MMETKNKGNHWSFLEFQFHTNCRSATARDFTVIVSEAATNTLKSLVDQKVLLPQKLRSA